MGRIIDANLLVIGSLLLGIWIGWFPEWLLRMHRFGALRSIAECFEDRLKFYISILEGEVRLFGVLSSFKKANLSCTSHYP